MNAIQNQRKTLTLFLKGTASCNLFNKFGFSII